MWARIACWSSSGMPEEHADGAHGDLGAEIRDEVEAARPDEWVQRARRVVPDLRLDGRHALGGEDAAHDPAVQVVVRRVLEDEHARRHLDLRLDHLEHRALGRAVGLPLDQAALHVVVAADRVELVLLVEVEGGLVPEPLPDRVGVGVDVEVVGVVVRRGRSRGHLVSLSQRRRTARSPPSCAVAL